jgi:hypothetical protein
MKAVGGTDEIPSRDDGQKGSGEFRIQGPPPELSIGRSSYRNNRYDRRKLIVGQIHAAHPS